jgi:hypothetical protein
MGHLNGKLPAVAVVTAAAVAACAPALAHADARAELDIGFTTQAPGTPSGLTFAVEYKNPSDPSAKPPALTGAEFTLPAGTRVDNAAVPKCRTTDEEIRARGRNACPAETLIGSGRLVAITGTGPPADPVEGEVVAFNGEGEIVEIVLVPGSDQAVGFDRITLDGTKLKAHPPATHGGPPDGRTAIKRIEIAFTPPKAGARPYVTTPAVCPPDALWRSSGSFTFGDGGSTTVTDAAPCAAAPAPRLTLRVTPLSVRAGRRARFRVRVSSATPGCAAGATVRLGRARATTDAGGHALLRKYLSRARAVTVRASKPGCGRATARVEVRRAAP